MADIVFPLRLTADQVRHMHALVSMSRDEHQRFIAKYRTEMDCGLQRELLAVDLGLMAAIERQFPMVLEERSAAG
jgi:hypothetical protein